MSDDNIKRFNIISLAGSGSGKARQSATLKSNTTHLASAYIHYSHLANCYFEKSTCGNSLNRQRKKRLTFKIDLKHAFDISGKQWDQNILQFPTSGSFEYGNTFTFSTVERYFKAKCNCDYVYDQRRSSTPNKIFP